MKTIFDPRYELLIKELVRLRDEKQETQISLSIKLKKPQSYVAKIESIERRLDVVELLDILEALETPPKVFFQRIGWIPKTDVNVAVPIRASVDNVSNGILLNLVSNEFIQKVQLTGITSDQYLKAEEYISTLFNRLNIVEPSVKNRDAVAESLQYCFDNIPDLNPSDAYHHIVYRLYLREYTRTTPGQSWVRAGGEGVQLVVQQRYNTLLNKKGISLIPLSNEALRVKALTEMGIYGKVGNSKLDFALYGTKQGKQVIFGGIHVKASFAERVSDDVPCSEAMMRAGYLSCLFTFDAKSYPPPNGDLVNRGELGSPETPTDKRLYIESHGSFDACFSYNLRTVPSLRHTDSGKRILMSTFGRNDLLPPFIISFWREFVSKI